MDVTSQVYGCRICFETTGELKAPCKCAGSVQHVHDSCLRQWVASRFSRSARPRCELCGTHYRITEREVQECVPLFTCPGLRRALLVPIAAGLFLACLFAASQLFQMYVEDSAINSKLLVLVLLTVAMLMTCLTLLFVLASILMLWQARTIWRVHDFQASVSVEAPKYKQVPVSENFANSALDNHPGWLACI